MRQKHLDQPSAQQFIKSQLTRAQPRKPKRHKSSDQSSSSDQAEEEKLSFTPLLERDEVVGGPVHPLKNFMVIASAMSLNQDVSVRNLYQIISEKLEAEK